MKIIPALIEDAPLIGQAVVEAIGNDIANEFAGSLTVNDVVAMFSRLAERTDSQYSYTRALKAVDDQGNTMGIIVAYDGALLHRLRKAFFEEAKNFLGKDLEGKMADECTPDEYYLDSLAVLPEYRGRGVAHALIDAMAEVAAASGKPLGLLCDKSNHRARRLYLSVGFHHNGERVFAGELMDHLSR